MTNQELLDQYVDNAVKRRDNFIAEINSYDLLSDYEKETFIDRARETFYNYICELIEFGFDNHLIIKPEVIEFLGDAPPKKCNNIPKTILLVDGNLL